MKRLKPGKVAAPLLPGSIQVVTPWRAPNEVRIKARASYAPVAVPVQVHQSGRNELTGDVYLLRAATVKRTLSHGGNRAVSDTDVARKTSAFTRIYDVAIA